MKKLIIIAICFISMQSFSQGSNNPLLNLKGPSAVNQMRTAFDAVNSRGQWRPITINNSIIGSPLALEGNKNTLVIFTKDDKVFKIPNGNYDAKTDKLVSEYAKDSVYSFGNSNIKHAKLNDVLIKKFKKEDATTRFYFVLSKGNKLSLLKGFFARIKQGNINVMTKLKTSKDKFVVFDKYFISTDNESVLEFKLRKRSILRLMSAHKSEVSTFVKENKLSYSKEKDVIKIFKYYHTL
jgi:hypothetical protein